MADTRTSITPPLPPMAKAVRLRSILMTHGYDVILDDADTFRLRPSSRQRGRFQTFTYAEAEALTKAA